MDRGSLTPEEIRKKFETLPEDIKSLVYSANMLNLLQNIAEKYKLHIDKLDTLEAETADVMTGFSKPEEFEKNISESLGVDTQTANLIAKDINEGLFLKIRESMKKMGEQPPAAPKPIVTQPVPQTSAPVQQPKPPATPAVPLQNPPLAPKPVTPMPQADMMLSQSTVSMPKVEAPKPGPYKADPYREPPE